MVADFVDHHARILPGRQWDPDSETGLWTCWVGLLYRSSLAVKDHLPRQMVSFCRNGMTGRHGCAGLGPPIRGRYRQAVHQAGRPACGPYGIAMDHSPLPSRSARFPISPLYHCSPFSFSFSEEPFDSVHTDWRQGIQILFRWISRGFL